jgi:hypothetical protein
MELFLGISVFINIALAILAFQLNKKQKTESYDVRMLLHDLTSGAGMVRIERISPVDVLIRTNRVRSE